ncbi:MULTISPECIES: glycosyltransferase [unclassified Streptomyces]|uniref:glycosyltransferase n=1 Tax=unclassified Streptomyces TaxID=2593676 RepID=UPI002DDBE6DD|nr:MULTISPECIES: glycosyltransferase [unclassified Streptomyces]WSB74573.1 glycosyltransferase [Streptomyces sp. NBC_01775]WSS17042.1 glycosyltransferase [Streptomyces sp. NBC_01186]WSS45785.1 glycosyltransferase [Streptomyces sp. NBC_01187]
MRALHIITGLGVGGAEQQLRLLLRQLPMESEVVTLTDPGAVAAGIRSDGIPVTHLGMAGNRDLSALPRLTRIIRQGRYDLVHTHLYRACAYGRIAARLAGVRTVVATEHSLGEAEIEGRPLTRSARALYLATERLGTTTVAVSDTVAHRLRAWGVPAARIETIPNGIEARRFRFEQAARDEARARLGLPHDAFVVGGVGRLVPGKRFDVLLRSVAALPGAWLLLVGEGPERAALERLARQLGVPDRVLLPGASGGEGPAGADGGAPVPGLPGLLAAMDVFASPSGEETFGISVLEALAAGLPVRHVTCPAIDELPAAEAPGARRVGASTAELTAELRGLRAADAYRLPVPAAVRRYDIGRTAERLMAVYTRLAGAAARPDAPSGRLTAPAERLTGSRAGRPHEVNR